ncbi:uncharacterized protein LOC117780949 [Drosophila innubila]|uniref:uncharacterized protein LOC117780949 n=1 Tax=Drosophila innubila TaxID=198719 RepID=UPI00148C1A8A|nr:uncharacterized protein LOC117780949 [Drosophila innubila]
METLSVCIAGLFQLLGVSFFFKQPEDQCSPAPTIGSWLFLLATLCFLCDMNLYPRHYMHMAKHWQLIFEIIAGVFLVEISTLVVWCNVEFVVFITTRKLLYSLANSDCIPWRLEYWLQGLSTSVVSGALLWFILQATDTIYIGNNFLGRLKRNWNEFWRILNGIYRMNSSERRRALRACKMATYPRRNNRCRQPPKEDDEDVEEEEDDY